MGIASSSSFYAPRFEWYHTESTNFWSYEIEEALKSPPLTVANLLCAQVEENHADKLGGTITNVVQWVVRKNKFDGAKFFNVPFDKISGLELLTDLKLAHLEIQGAKSQVPFAKLPTCVKVLKLNFCDQHQWNDSTLWTYLTACTALERLSLTVPAYMSVPKLQTQSLDALLDTLQRVPNLHVDCLLWKQLWSRLSIQKFKTLLDKQTADRNTTNVVPKEIRKAAYPIDVVKFLSVLDAKQPLELILAYPFDRAVFADLPPCDVEKGFKLQLSSTETQPRDRPFVRPTVLCGNRATDIHVWEVSDAFCAWIADSMEEGTCLKRVTACAGAVPSEEGRKLLVDALGFAAANVTFPSKWKIQPDERIQQDRKRKAEQKLERQRAQREKEKSRERWCFAKTEKQLLHDVVDGYAACLQCYEHAECFRTAHRTAMEDAKVVCDLLFEQLTPTTAQKEFKQTMLDSKREVLVEGRSLCSFTNVKEDPDAPATYSWTLEFSPDEAPPTSTTIVVPRSAVSALSAFLSRHQTKIEAEE